MITINNEMVMNEGMYNVLDKTMMYKDSSIGYEMMMNANMEVAGRMNLLISLLDKNTGRQLGVGIFDQINEVITILRSIDVTTITSDDMYAIIAHVCNIVAPINNNNFATKSHKSKIMNVAVKDFKAVVGTHKTMSNVTTEPVTENVAGFAKAEEEKVKIEKEDVKNEEPKKEVVYKPVRTIKELKENLAKGRDIETDKPMLEYASLMEEFIKDMKDDEPVDEELYTELMNKVALKRAMNELKNEIPDDEILQDVMDKFSNTINKMIEYKLKNADVPYNKELSKELNNIKKYVEKRLTEKVVEIVEETPKSTKELVESFKEASSEVVDMVAIEVTKEGSNYDKAKKSMMEKIGDAYSPSMDNQIHEYATTMAKTMDNIDRINGN